MQVLLGMGLMLVLQGVGWGAWLLLRAHRAAHGWPTSQLPPDNVVRINKGVAYVNGEQVEWPEQEVVIADIRLARPRSRRQ